jgi:4,5-DOPA dioxygenase extradiol
MVNRLPAIFFGHGNPMNALRSNAYTRGWSEVAAAVPKPQAILAISAHWYVPFTSVTAMDAPRTIHDFGGFPPDLYAVEYPAPGNLSLAQRVQSALAPTTVGLDQKWGLDHGTWSVLCHAFPEAATPVVQLSIDETQPPAFHYELGRRLRPLRDEGVFLMGSGNLVHNLHSYAWGQETAAPFDWAVRFEKLARTLLEAGNDGALVNYEALGADARLSVPTPDHFLPLLYVLGTRHEGEGVRFPVEGVDGGSVSMLTIQIG